MLGSSIFPPEVCALLALLPARPAEENDAGIQSVMATTIVPERRAPQARRGWQRRPGLMRAIPLPEIGGAGVGQHVVLAASKYKDASSASRPFYDRVDETR
jgi:hypothetical protein